MILEPQAGHRIPGAQPLKTPAYTDTLIALHAFLSDGLMADPPPWAASAAAPWRSGQRLLPIALPQRLEELFGIVTQMAAEITDPFEQAF